MSAAEPATGPITGETPVRLTGDGFVATPSLRVRFTRVEPLEGTPAYLEVEPLPLPLPLPYPPLPLPLPLPLTLTLTKCGVDGSSSRDGRCWPEADRSNQLEVIKGATEAGVSGLGAVQV